MVFAYPLILGLPILVVALLLRRRSGAALLYSDCSFLAGIRPSWRVRLRKPVLSVLGLAALCALTIAAARPQRVSLIPQELEARNLMLVLDLSRSMEANDFRAGRGYATRIAAVKAVVREFVAARAGDRIGLAIFGSAAFLKAPLTFDSNIIQNLVEELELGMAGDATAMGDGIGVALKALKDLPAETSAIILLTDGVSNAGQINPLKAAQVAADLGIRIHAIGIGSDQPLAQPPLPFLGRSLGPRQPEFDEATLRQIAELTGGMYFSASSVEGLKQVYAEIDSLEVSAQPSPEAQQIEELFPGFLTWGVGIFVLYLLLANTVFLRLP